MNRFAVKARIYLAIPFPYRISPIYQLLLHSLERERGARIALTAALHRCLRGIGRERETTKDVCLCLVKKHI